MEFDQRFDDSSVQDSDELVISVEEIGRPARKGRAKPNGRDGDDGSEKDSDR